MIFRQKLEKHKFHTKAISTVLRLKAFHKSFCVLVQMSSTKHLASKKSSKCARIDSDNFKYVEAGMAYNDCYKRATIIMERVVKLETLEDTCIPEVFKDVNEAAKSEWSCVLRNR